MIPCPCAQLLQYWQAAKVRKVAYRWYTSEVGKATLYTIEEKETRLLLDDEDPFGVGKVNLLNCAYGRDRVGVVMI